MVFQSEMELDERRMISSSCKRQKNGGNKWMMIV